MGSRQEPDYDFWLLSGPGGPYDDDYPPEDYQEPWEPPDSPADYETVPFNWSPPHW